MKTTMKLNVETTCPIDGARIDVALDVFVGGGFLRVEDLLGACQSATSEPVTQEDFTRSLAKLIRYPVKTIGVHSGVVIICEAF